MKKLVRRRVFERKRSPCLSDNFNVIYSQEILPSRHAKKNSLIRVLQDDKFHLFRFTYPRRTRVLYTIVLLRNMGSAGLAYRDREISRWSEVFMGFYGRRKSMYFFLIILIVIS